jgi:signal transduction histidine kinase
VARILIVDDNEANRYAVGRMLRAAGYDTLDAATGRRAIELARENPTLIVLDVNLPDLNGFEVVQALRDDPATAMIPILHLSASYMRDEDQVFGLDNGANGYLTHPVEPAVLLATVRTLLRARAIQDEREGWLAAAERARIEAETANRAKSEFLATMSHEIRTPINAILGYAQILDLGIAGPVSADQRTQLDRMRRSAAHLLTLVNELLDLATVESGRMRVDARAAPIDEVMDDAVVIVRTDALARGITIVRERGPDHTLCFVGDRGRVRQILVNLLSNAVKFSAAGSRVFWRAERIEAPEELPRSRDGMYVAVRVRDRGIGVGPEQAATIFEPFVQGETGRTRTWGGSGLGLATSRRLARLMGGDVTMQSELGEGSVFTLWLPGSNDPVASGCEVPALPRTAPASIDASVLRQLGQIVAGEALDIGQAVVLRIRTDSAFPPAGDLTDAQLIDHIPLSVMDLGLALTLMAQLGADALGFVDDGNIIRNAIATLHGAQRKKLGWQSAQVALEYEVLSNELTQLLRSRAAASEAQLDGALELLGRLLEQTKLASLRGFAEAEGEQD